MSYIGKRKREERLECKREREEREEEVGHFLERRELRKRLRKVKEKSF